MRKRRLTKYFMKGNRFLCTSCHEVSLNDQQLNPVLSHFPKRIQSKRLRAPGREQRNKADFFLHNLLYAANHRHRTETKAICARLYSSSGRYRRVHQGKSASRTVPSKSNVLSNGHLVLANSLSFRFRDRMAVQTI